MSRGDRGRAELGWSEGALDVGADPPVLSGRGAGRRMVDLGVKTVVTRSSALAARRAPLGPRGARGRRPVARVNGATMPAQALLPAIRTAASWPTCPWEARERSQGNITTIVGGRVSNTSVYGGWCRRWPGRRAGAPPRGRPGSAARCPPAGRGTIEVAFAGPRGRSRRGCGGPRGRWRLPQQRASDPAPATRSMPAEAVNVCCPGGGAARRTPPRGVSSGQTSPSNAGFEVLAGGLDCSWRHGWS